MKNYSMKNYAVHKTNSIHPIYTREGWVYLLLPISIMEGFNFSGKPFAMDAKQPIITTHYLN
jgi:hypothetical protein